MSEDTTKKPDPEKTESEQPKERQVKARVLTQCAYGKADDVVLLSEADAKQATADGIVDTDPAAVAYAESLAAAA